MNLDGNGNDFGLDDMALTAPAPNPQLTANNVATGSISTAGTINPTQISPLSAIITGPTGATVAAFTLGTVPAVGTLRVGSTTGPVVAAGQVLTVAQANQLFFDPVAGFVGPASFTYTASDDSGAGSNNTATYTMPIDNRPLPVELVSFVAQVVRAVDVQLTWRTATELNNDHFEVQRSANGREFERITQVAGQGISTSATSYAHTDAGIGTRTAGPLC